MPSIQFELTGLPETMRLLEQLGPDLARAAEPIQRETAEAAAATIRGLYRYRKGNLVKGVQVRRLSKGRVVAAHVVENVWWLASIYEHGSRTIRETRRGYARGQQPARPVFTRTMNDAQRIFHARTLALLRQHGLTVVYAAA